MVFWMQAVHKKYSAEDRSHVRKPCKEYRAHPIRKKAKLHDEKHRKFLILIGMLNWIVNLGQIDITYTTMLLSRFTASPRQGHLHRALKVFGYLKKPNRRICIDSKDPDFEGFEAEFEKDLVEILEGG